MTGWAKYAAAAMRQRINRRPIVPPPVKTWLARPSMTCLPCGNRESTGTKPTTPRRATVAADLTAARLLVQKTSADDNKNKTTAARVPLTRIATTKNRAQSIPQDLSRAFESERQHTNNKKTSSL